MNRRDRSARASVERRRSSVGGDISRRVKGDVAGVGFLFSRENLVRTSFFPAGFGEDGGKPILQLEVAIDLLRGEALLHRE